MALSNDNNFNNFNNFNNSNNFNKHHNQLLQTITSKNWVSFYAAEPSNIPELLSSLNSSPAFSPSNLQNYFSNNSYFGLSKEFHNKLESKVQLIKGLLKSNFGVIIKGRDSRLGNNNSLGGNPDNPYNKDYLLAIKKFIEKDNFGEFGNKDKESEITPEVTPKLFTMYLNEKHIDDFENLLYISYDMRDVAEVFNEDIISGNAAEEVIDKLKANSGYNLCDNNIENNSNNNNNHNSSLISTEPPLYYGSFWQVIPFIKDWSYSGLCPYCEFMLNQEARGISTKAANRMASENGWIGCSCKVDFNNIISEGFKFWGIDKGGWLEVFEPSIISDNDVVVDCSKLPITII